MLIYSVNLYEPCTQTKNLDATLLFNQDNISDELNKSKKGDPNIKYIENHSYGYYSKHGTIFDELNSQRFVKHNKNNDLSNIMGSVVYTETWTNKQILDMLNMWNNDNILSKTFISFGAGDKCLSSIGDHCDEANRLLQEQYFGWLVDYDLTSLTTMRSQLDYQSKQYQMIHESISTDNIMNLFSTYNFSANPDLIKMGLDRNDCDIVEKMLINNVKPKVWQLEYNPLIPPPIYYNWPFMEYASYPDISTFPQIYNECSLQWINHIMESYGYVLFQVLLWDAWFVHKDWIHPSVEVKSPLEWWMFNFNVNNSKWDLLSRTVLEPAVDQLYEMASEALSSSISMNEWTQYALSKYKSIIDKSPARFWNYVLGLQFKPFAVNEDNNKQTVKRFVYMIQIQDDKSFDLYSHMLSPESDVIVACFRKDCSQHNYLFDTLFIPSTTFTEGRNILFEYAKRKEIKEKKNYIYYIFMDGDWKPRLLYDVIKIRYPTYIHFFETSRAPWNYFEYMLLKYEPAIGFPRAMSHHNSPDTKYEEVTFSLYFDAVINAFHKDTVDILLPYSTTYEKTCWWTSQSIVLVRSLCYSSGILQFNFLEGDNEEHSEYPKCTEYTYYEESAFPLFEKYFVSDTVLNPQYINLITQRPYVEFSKNHQPWYPSDVKHTMTTCKPNVLCQLEHKGYSLC